MVEERIRADLVGGKDFAVDASLIVADANKQRSIPGAQWSKELGPSEASRAQQQLCRSMWLWTRKPSLPPQLLWTASLAAIKGAHCLIDSILQKLQPAANNHFSVAITLSFVIEFLTLIDIRAGSLQFATGFRLRTEQQRCGQRNR